MLQPNDQQLQEPIALRWLPRPLLVGGVYTIVVLAGLAIGIVAGQGSVLLLLALILPPIAIIGAMFSVRYFAFLVLIFPLTTLVMRFAQLPTGTASTLPISLVAALALLGIWIIGMYTRRTWQIPSTPFNRSLFTFIVICCITLPWGILWRDPIPHMETLGIGFVITQMASLLTLLASMGIPWLIGYWIDQSWKITFYLGVFLVCGTLMTFSQLLGLTQNILNDAGLWGLWYTTTLFGILFTFPNLRKRWRIGLLALLGAHLYLALVRNSLWISGWLPAMVGIAAVIFFHSRRLFVVLALGSIAFAMIGPGRPYIESVIANNIDEGGLERLDIWARSLGVVSEHWLFGTGPAGYAAYNMAYFPEDARSTHNNFFDILAQFGILGLSIWCWFMATSLWFGWQTIRRAAPGILRTTAIIATSGWAAALFSMNLGDWILPFAYNQGIRGFSYTVYSWIFLGLLVSVHRLQEEERRKQEAGGGAQEAGGRRQEAGIYDRT